jgi:hypothetical protein
VNRTVGTERGSGCTHGLGGGSVVTARGLERRLEVARLDDDGSGWNAVLLEVWSGAVRDAVVRRIERATVGRRGWLVRALADPDGSPAGWTETLHALVVAAIRDETGADLDELGSQAAWECYEQVWKELAERWRDGGELVTVPLGVEPDVARLVRELPPEAAASAGADVTRQPPDPLWLAGRLRVDVEGLRAYLRLDGGRVPRDVALRIETIMARISG